MFVGSQVHTAVQVMDCIEHLFMRKGNRYRGTEYVPTHSPPRTIWKVADKCDTEGESLLLPRLAARQYKVTHHDGKNLPLN